MYNTETQFKNRFLCDCLYTVLIMAGLVTTYWRGLWILLDVKLYPRDAKKSILYTYIISMSCYFLAIMTQYLSYYLCKKYKASKLGLIIADNIIILISNAFSITLWRAVWNTWNEFFLKNNKELSNWISHLVGFFGLALLYSSKSICCTCFRKDGESLKSLFFDIKYLRYFFLKREINISV